MRRCQQVGFCVRCNGVDDGAKNSIFADIKRKTAETAGGAQYRGSRCLLQSIAQSAVGCCGGCITIYSSRCARQLLGTDGARNGQDVGRGIGIVGCRKWRVFAAHKELNAKLFRGFIADFDNDGFDQNLFRPNIKLAYQFAQSALHLWIGSNDQGVCAFIACHDNGSTSANTVHARTRG